MVPRSARLGPLGGPALIRRALLALLCAAPLFADQTLLSNGPPDEKLDLVFLGDGYTAAERGLYRDDVRRFVDHLFSQPPFSENKALFNVHRVDVDSVQSGADDSCAGTSVDTAFDAGYHPTGADCRLLFTYSGAKVYAAAARAPGYDPGAGLVVVIVNAAAHGGAATAGGYCVVSRGATGPEAMAHELGHSFGLLADEYDVDSRAYAGAEPRQPNVTVETDPARVKWSRWIAPGTPLPTAAPSVNQPGLYEGAMGWRYGVFRPTYDSKMRSLNRSYDAVNTALLVERMDALLPPSVEIVSPVPGERVSGVFLVRATAEDGVGLSRMELVVEGSVRASLSVRGASAEVSWPWRLDDEGPRAILVRAVDTAGNLSEKTIVVSSSMEEASLRAEAREEAPPFLSPGLKDGINDEISFGAEGGELTVYDRQGRAVFSAADASGWDGRGAGSGVYVVHWRGPGGREARRVVTVAR